MLNQLTISEAAAGLRQKKFSARELMQSCLDRVKAVDSKVKAFLSYDEKDALAQADAADKRLASGNAASPLLGIPIGMKDLLCVKDHPCNCASKILGNFRSVYDATVVHKLKDAGAIIFGRLNMDEFAMGSSTENSGFFTTRNPWDLERIPVVLPVAPPLPSLPTNASPHSAPIPAVPFASPPRSADASASNQPMVASPATVLSHSPLPSIRSAHSQKRFAIPRSSSAPSAAWTPSIQPAFRNRSQTTQPPSTATSRA